MNAKQFRVMQVISNLDVGGAQEVVRTLAENLNREECVSSVVCTFRDGPLAQEIRSLGIPVEVLPERQHSVLSGPAFLHEILEYRKHLRGLVEKYEIDVIQTHLLRSMDFLLLSLRTSKGPKVYWTFHNALFDLREDHLSKHRWLLKPKRFSHHLLYWLGSKRVDGIVAVSKDVKSSILDTMFGISSDKITIIRNCVDVKRYHQGFDRGKTRAQFGLSDKDLIGIAVATFKRQKGHVYLIEAASELVKQFPDFHLLFVGDGELKTEMESLVKQLNLDGRIHFLGTRSDVPALLAASDLFILPSLWEGLPMALIEAMASGLPVVATRVSGTNEVMADEKTGFLVEPGNSRGLVDAIQKVLDDPGGAKVMGLASRSRVEELFSARTQAAEYIDLFTSGQEFGANNIAMRGNQI